MESWQIGRSDGELKLSDLKTENLVELLRDIYHHLHRGCVSYGREGRCSTDDRATAFFRAYDEYIKKGGL